MEIKRRVLKIAIGGGGLTFLGNFDPRIPKLRFLKFTV